MECRFDPVNPQGIGIAKDKVIVVQTGFPIVTYSTKVQMKMAYMEYVWIDLWDRHVSLVGRFNHSKGQLISKGNFGVSNSSTNLKIFISALAYLGRDTSFFGRIEKIKEALSKLTDL